LKRKRSHLRLTDQQVEIILDNLCALSEFQKLYFLWRPYLKDPKDDHVLEVAVASQTRIIVTHNIKDFIGIGKFGIQAIPPKDLLKEIP
jgi:predicted nucleic acid-binding protein